MCGPAGSGKSTWINENYIWDYDALISRDAIRFALIKEGDDYFSKEQEVLNEFFKEIEEVTSPNKHFENVFIDATHLNPKARARVLCHIHKDCYIVAVSFEVPLKVVVERNAKRNGLALVPESAIRNMYNCYKIPTLSEGFNEIWHIDAEDVNRKEVKE